MAKLVRERESLVDRASDAIVALIHDRRLSTGDALPSTAELIEDFGVSRTVVREALAELAGRGIVRRAGREYLIGTPGAGELGELLGFRIAQQGGDVLELMEFREAVEVRSARLAAERRSDADLAELRRLIEVMTEFRSEEAFHEADVQFHRSVAAASHNGIFAMVLDALAPLLRASRLESLTGWRMRDVGVAPVLNAHRAVFDAIAAGDSDAAAQAMREHLTQTRIDIETGRGAT